LLNESHSNIKILIAENIRFKKKQTFFAIGPAVFAPRTHIYAAELRKRSIGTLTRVESGQEPCLVFFPIVIQNGGGFSISHHDLRTETSSFSVVRFIDNMSFFRVVNTRLV
jgi:hypothetical protein